MAGTSTERTPGFPREFRLVEIKLFCSADNEKLHCSLAGRDAAMPDCFTIGSSSSILL